MDVEKRLLLAAEPIKRAAEGFDGADFSKRLYAKLGITPHDDQAAQGADADQRNTVGLRPKGYGDQG
ncbi:hypothetical protein ACGFX4_38405 [Kitasatospora sp. NPDC048365]|uniref:hypothetical protein n=1 Tax=Kitasatospora sp. NPDC048365 TaxID=3364050 RepID=UPI00371AF1BE